MSGPLATSVESFDDLVDSKFAALRGRGVADPLASVASFLGDHGLVWFLLAVARSPRGRTDRFIAIRGVVFTGVVAPVVNAGLKRATGRVRPELRMRHGVLVRIPRTASFPSGHTLAAWSAATLLAEASPPAVAFGYYAAACAVSLSRVHLRLHHATDVLAGTAIGILLGRLGRAMFPLPADRGE
jgi:undecaprenyl-diphosphatase